MTTIADNAAIKAVAPTSRSFRRLNSRPSENIKKMIPNSVTGMLDFKASLHPLVMGESVCRQKLREVHQRAATAISGCDSRGLGPVRRDHQSTIGEATKIDE